MLIMIIFCSQLIKTYLEIKYYIRPIQTLSKNRINEKYLHYLLKVIFKRYL